jgi:hypothetical protein
MRSVCRKTDEFPVPVAAALIGSIFGVPGIGLSLWDRPRAEEVANGAG